MHHEIFCWSCFNNFFHVLFLSENQEKLYLYLSVSVGGGLLVLLLVVIAKLLWQKHRLKKTAKFHESANQQSTSLPNGFTDDISEIDADIDLTMTAPPITIISPHSPSEVSFVHEIENTMKYYYTANNIQITI